MNTKDVVPCTLSEIQETQRALQGKTIEDVFSVEQLEKLREHYFISFNCGILHFSPKKPYTCKRIDEIKGSENA